MQRLEQAAELYSEVKAFYLLVDKLFGCLETPTTAALGQRDKLRAEQATLGYFLSYSVDPSARQRLYSEMLSGTKVDLLDCISTFESETPDRDHFLNFNDKP